MKLSDLFSKEIKDQVSSQVSQYVKTLRETEPAPQPVQRIPPMPAQSLQLFESASVVLDGSGNGTARITPYGPRNGGLTWQVDSVSVTVAPSPGNTAVINESTASAYVAYGVFDTSPNSFQGNTITGSSGDTCGLGVTIQPSDYIIVVWTGGDPGATATMRISGTINPPGNSLCHSGKRATDSITLQ